MGGEGGGTENSRNTLIDFKNEYFYTITPRACHFMTSQIKLQLTNLIPFDRCKKATLRTKGLIKSDMILIELAKVTVLKRPVA